MRLTTKPFHSLNSARAIQWTTCNVLLMKTRSFIISQVWHDRPWARREKMRWFSIEYKRFPVQLQEMSSIRPRISLRYRSTSFIFLITGYVCAGVYRVYRKWTKTAFKYLDDLKSITFCKWDWHQWEFHRIQDQLSNVCLTMCLFRSQPQMLSYK